LRLFSFGGYELALAALALVVFGAYDSYPIFPYLTIVRLRVLRLNEPAISLLSFKEDNGKLSLNSFVWYG